MSLTLHNFRVYLPNIFVLFSVAAYAYDMLTINATLCLKKVYTRSLLGKVYIVELVMIGKK